MRSRRVRLPRLSGTVLLALCCALVAGSIAVGLAMRGSLTHYGEDIDAVGRLPYSIFAGSERTLDRSSRDETDGYGIEDSTIVVRATFNGSREYVYQSFLSDVVVDDVIRGDGVGVGDVISVLEPLKIVDPDNPSSGAQLSDLRGVMPSTNSACMFGVTPLREGQEYLLFLTPKAYPDELASENRREAYCLAVDPYCRVAVDTADHQDRVHVVAVGEELTFSDASEYDMLVTDEAAKERYVSTCQELLEGTR